MWHRPWFRLGTATALALALLAFAAGSSPAARGDAGFVARIDLDGAIGPAAAEYVDAAMRQADADGATAIVLQMDTPGGLAESMRRIVGAILASRLPVLGYVAPAGARAASAGTYILYACPVAAMAPATHLGAATPVSLGGGTPLPMGGTRPASSKSSDTPETKGLAPDAESRKVLNDAIAYIRSLAQMHGRNSAWAEQAVRGAATLTASEAASQHVVDFVAADVSALLTQADGRTVKLGEQTVTLKLRGLPVRDYPPDWRARFLGIITNPTIAYLLLLAGIYGLILEAFHPGTYLPGVTGGICLLVGLYALQLLPVNYAGLALMALGVGLLLAEAFVPTAGVVGIGGVIAFVIGSIMLFQRGVPGYEVNVGVIAGLAFCAVALLAMLLRLVTRARRTRPFLGDEPMLQAGGELLQAVPAGGESWALIGGERWRVHCDVALPAGAHVRVTARQGLLLHVTPSQANKGELS